MAKCLNPYPLAGASFTVPCGKCVNCLKNYSRQWAIRCMDELKASNGVGCFLTLTYAKTDGDLHRDDLQKFIKRLRAKIEPQRVRYFYCGEYGGKGNRPHYHIMLFGWRPDDLKQVTVKGNVTYYQSDIIESLWKLGFVSIGDINFLSAMYCAKYLQKLDEREHRVRPFVGMSLKPGLGYSNFKFDDLINEKRYIDGKVYSLPRYYIDKAEKDGFNVDMLRLHRNLIARSLSGDQLDFSVIKDLKKEEERLLASYKKIVLT